MIDWGRLNTLRDEVGEEDFEEVVDLFLDEVESVIDRHRRLLSSFQGAAFVRPAQGAGQLTRSSDHFVQAQRPRLAICFIGLGAQHLHVSRWAASASSNPSNGVATYCGQTTDTPTPCGPWVMASDSAKLTAACFVAE